jgi:cyclopropane fatty-acyl-phospholipid synthase-like methyltransferase
MPLTGRAPNRVFDMEEMQREEFRAVIDEMDRLVAQDPISYLHPSKRWEYPWALERARLKPGSRVLDAGCGASIMPIYLAKLGHRVSAIDLEIPEGLDRMHGVEVDYRKAELTALPFDDETFDAVFCISVIEHLGREGTSAALDELRRVTRRGGRVLLTTDYYRDANEPMWYEGPGESFPVDWAVFDEKRLKERILAAPGLAVEGAVDLEVDWDRTSPVMRRFHGYPYTSVGISLVRL